MQLTFLGTGAAMPDGERFQSGYLLAAGEDHLLVDCGSGVLHALARTDVGYAGVDAVLLTHHHLDHVSDLAALLKARWLADEPRLTVAGPPGTADLLDRLLDTHAYMAGRFDLTVRDLSPDSAASLAGFDLAARETRHSMQCLAYRVDVGDGPRVTFSGDTEADESVIRFADGSDVLVHDCSFPDGMAAENHPTATELGAALGAVDPDLGRVFLTHLYPHAAGHRAEMVASVRERYDGDVAIAPEGETVVVGGEG